MTNKKGHPMNRAHKRQLRTSTRTPKTIMAGIAILIAGLLYAGFTNAQTTTITADTLDLTRPVDGLYMLREYQGLNQPVSVTQTPQEAVQLDTYNYSIAIN